MDRIATGIAQRRRQQRRKLSVNQEQHVSFCRNDRMIGLTGGKSQSRINVGALQIRIILQDRFARLSG